jgi:hypothetical protein
LNDKVALLYESNTRFGRESAEDFGDNAILFPFPLHISEVRGAYQQTTGATKGDRLRLPTFGSKLRLPMDGESRTRDTEPSLDSGVSAVKSERILSTMLKTIAHERIRNVLIVASLVRAHCPECRLLLTGSDLLFSHPDYSADLRGAIIASTYPLYSKNQSRSFPFNAQDIRVACPGEPEQGYYNATVALLNPKDADSFIEYGPPFPSLLRTGEFSQRRPPSGLASSAREASIRLRSCRSRMRPPAIMSSKQRGKNRRDKPSSVPCMRPYGSFRSLV